MKEKSCSMCLVNCRKMHGSEDEDDGEDEGPICFPRRVKKEDDSISSRHPSFLKKMKDITMSSTLKVPPSFVKAHVKRLGMSVTLEGPGGEKWRVELGGSFQNFTISFRNGWKKFVVDHVLQIGDQLSFTLTADRYFQVEVYDESGSQKVSAIDATNSPTTPVECKAKWSKIGNHEPGCRGSGSLARQTKLPFKFENAKSPAEQSLMIPQPLMVAQSNGSELRGINLPRNDCEDEEPKRTKSREDQKSNPPDAQGLLPQREVIGGLVISSRRPLTDAEKIQTLQAARALTLTNPSTVMVMMRAYVYRGFWMSLTRQFARDWMPKVTRHVTLINKAGKKWPVKWLYKETDGRGSVTSGLSAGWRGFALDHRLEESDVCVFELVDQVNFVLLVHVFRALGPPGEDDKEYSPSSRKASKGDGSTKRKSTQEADGLSSHHQQKEVPTKKILNTILNRRYSSTGGEGSASYSTPEGLDNSTNCNLENYPSIDEDISHGVSRLDNVVGNILEKASGDKQKKAKTACFCGAATDPNAGALALTRNPHDFRIRPLRAKLSPISLKKVTRKALNNDLMQLGKEILARNNIKPATPPPSSAQVDGNADCHSKLRQCQTQAIIPYQEPKELANLGENFSFPIVREHAPLTCCCSDRQLMCTYAGDEDLNLVWNQEIEDMLITTICFG